MKPSINIVIHAILILFVISCRKNEVQPGAISSLNIANVVENGTSIKLGGNPLSIGSKESSKFSLKAGLNQLYVFPEGDSLHPYYSHSINTARGDMYSLFLSGQFPIVDELLIKEEIPTHTDSTAGLRFINLVPDSGPLNVNLMETPDINEVTDLQYQNYTNFKTYLARAENLTYDFEVRNAIDNSLLASYSLTPPRFGNVTLVIYRKMSGTASIGIMRVANDRP